MTFWVAMAAWSVPGHHSTSKPRMRRWRHSVSWMENVDAWPMCSAPVMFGGGSAMTYAGLVLVTSACPTSSSLQRSRHFGSTLDQSKCFSIGRLSIWADRVLLARRDRRAGLHVAPFGRERRAGVDELRGRGGELQRPPRSPPPRGSSPGPSDPVPRYRRPIRSTPDRRSRRRTRRARPVAYRCPGVSGAASGTTTAAGCPAAAAATSHRFRGVSRRRGSGSPRPRRSGPPAPAAARLLASNDWSKPPSARSDAGRLGAGAAIVHPDALLVMTCVSVIRVTAKNTATAAAARTMARRLTLRPYAPAPPPRSHRRDAWAPR